MKIIYLDTETTDIGESARLVQLAYKNEDSGKVVNAFFKPPVPISYGSMAVHHVTNEMVEDKPSFIGSSEQIELIKELGDNILIAHNASFDIGVLKNEQVEVGKYIDTLRLARHLIDSDVYNLQYLRYFLKFNNDVSAHEAMGDVIVLESLFKYLKNIIVERFSLANDEDIINKMLELTQTPVLIETFAFGKHKGKSFKEVGVNDKSYLQWLYNSETQKPVAEQNEDLVYTLKNYI